MVDNDISRVLLKITLNFLMPNPNPRQTDLFKQKRFTALDNPEVALARKPVSVKVPEHISDFLETLDPKIKGALLRRILVEGIEKYIEDTQ